MTSPLPAPLPPAPSPVLDAAGVPRFGTYAGGFGPIDIESLTGRSLLGRVRRLFKEKRWTWSCVVTPEIIAAFTIVDVGLLSSGFFVAVDVRTGKLITDRSWLGRSGAAEVNELPNEGARVRFEAGGCRMSIDRPVGTSAYQLRIEAKGLSLVGAFDSHRAMTPLSAILRLGPGRMDCTQKTVHLRASGALTIDGQRYGLDGGLGGIDYTQGLLPRHTCWRWGFALGHGTDGTPVAFNFTDGMGGADAGENALWIDGALEAIAVARFDFDPKRPEERWTVRTSDGAVDLEFRPMGAHREDRNLLVARSHFYQAAGVYRGRLRSASGRTVEVEGLAGFAEDQDIIW